MTELTDVTVADAMTDCAFNAGLRVGFAFDSQRRTEEFARSLHSLWMDGEVPMAYYQSSMFEIHFNTGSSIFVFNANNLMNIVGNSFDKVLYDPRCFDLEILRSCERSRSKTYLAEPLMEIDTGPLDDFIGAFSIIENYP